VREIWELAQQIGLAHSCRKVREDFVNRHPHVTDARLAAALSGLDGDDAFVRHPIILQNESLVSYSAAVGDGVGDGRHGLIDEALIR
jgi:hypothetical protein